MAKEIDRTTEQSLSNVGMSGKDFHGAIYESYNPSPYFMQPEIHVGQEKPREELVKIITQSPPGTVAVVSEVFGSGKTALMHNVIHELVDNEYLKREEIYRAFAIGGELKPEVFGGDRTPGIPKVCFVEELDRHLYDKERLEGQLTQAGKLLDQVPVVILIGDRSLRNPSIIRLVNSPREPIYVPLNPLTSDLFKKIVEMRLVSYFAKKTVSDLDSRFYRAVFSRLRKEGRQALDNLIDVTDRKIGEIESRISPEDVERLFDPEFLAYLIPNTEPHIANARHALYVLAMLAKNLPNDDNPVVVSGELFARSWGRDRRAEKFQVELDYTGGKEREFILWLHDYIRRNYDGSVPLRPLSTEEIRQVCPLDIATTEEYEEKILRPLSRETILAPTGIPFSNDGHPIQGPYLPYPQTFLEARYGPKPDFKPSQLKLLGV